MALIEGTPEPDVLTGTADRDRILGRGGSDFISGREGDDVIFAGSGDDTVAGDIVPVPGVAPGPGVVSFGPFPPPFGGTPGNNLIFAGAGDDSILAGFGADTVFGEAGDDTIVGHGTAGISPTGFAGLIAADGPDLLFGGGGDDLLRGGGGGDLLYGGQGADTLVGNTDVDTLVGGSGPDVFVFGRLQPGASFALDTGTGPGNRDVILDFHGGEDRLDLSAYRNFFARPDGAPSEPIFLGTDPFVASFAPQVRYQIEDGLTVVQVFAPLGSPPSGLHPPVPGGPGAEIELAGEHRLAAEDFILA